MSALRLPCSVAGWRRLAGSKAGKRVLLKNVKPLVFYLTKEKTSIPACGTGSLAAFVRLQLCFSLLSD